MPTPPSNAKIERVVIIGEHAHTLYLGPIPRLITDCIASFLPFYRFGLTALSIITETRLTGLFSGILAKRVRPFFAVILGYIPECTFSCT